MKTTVKSIRLMPDEWEQLDAIAKASGTSLSRAVALLIAEHADCTDEIAEAGAVTAPVTAETAQGSEGPSDKGNALAVLAAQLATKDEQITRLMDALAASQDATRAAQALHAAETAGRAIEPRTGRLAAWWEHLTGKGRDGAA